MRIHIVIRYITINSKLEKDKFVVVKKPTVGIGSIMKQVVEEICRMDPLVLCAVSIQEVGVHGSSQLLVLCSPQ